jgi:hypothetical protein
MRWLSPAVMFIESAIDSLKSADSQMLASQAKELNSLGDARAQQVGASGITPDLLAGYQIGLQTARMVLCGSPLLVLKGVKPEDLL